jgi:hypothetical protein
MREWTLVAAAAVLLAACSSPRMMHGASAAACKKKDNSADCAILVDVSLNAAETACTAKVLDSQLDVGFSKNSRDKWIEWMLSESSDERAGFTRDGIAPKTTPSGNETRWNDNFKNGGASHGGRQFKWKNLNDPAQAGTAYEYMVKVEVRLNGGRTLSCQQDPVIRNQR